MKALYDDNRILVTQFGLSTPSQIYPLAHATVRLRRDLFWLAASSGVLSSATLAIYGDLLTASELTLFVIAPIALWVVAKAIGILVLDSPGHPRAFIVAGSGRARKIFTAIRAAKAAEPSHSYAIESREADFGK